MRGTAPRGDDAAGYRLVHEEPHELFGDGLKDQIWELDLSVSRLARDPS
jgi:hypothetical protein